MAEIGNKEIFVGKHGRLHRKEDLGPTKGQRILDKANQILEDNPLKGVRYRKSDPDTRSGPVKIIVPGKK